MEHKFNVEIATKVGVLEAIILECISYWYSYNKANNTNYYDNDYWSFNSVKAWTELLPYATIMQIRRSLSKLKEHGYIKINSFNNNPFDQTKWYSLTEKGKELCQQNLNNIADSDLTNPFVKNNKCICSLEQTNTISILSIKKNKEENKNNINIILKEEKNNDTSTQFMPFEQFWNAYPTTKRKTNKKGCLKAWQGIPNITTEWENILKGLEYWKQTKEWNQQGGEYICAPLVFLHQERWKSILEEKQKEQEEVNAFINSEWLNNENV